MVKDTDSKQLTETLKFLCSYGGRILPRSTDGKLRYVGGITRVLAVDRSVSFAELMVKLGELCGQSVTLTCQLPNEDLETLISIKSDEELANIVEEYDRAASSSKIRAILFPPKSIKQVSPPSSGAVSPKSPLYTAVASPPAGAFGRFVPRYSSPRKADYSVGSPRFAGCRVQGNPSDFYRAPHYYNH